jgi:hypothetical protein
MEALGVMEMAKIVATIGLPSAITALAFWWGSRYMTAISEQTTQRETRMSARIEKLEDLYREQLVSLIGENTTALNANSHAINDLRDTVSASQTASSAMLTKLMERDCSREDTPRPTKPR